jgi:hypothetical protein
MCVDAQVTSPLLRRLVWLHYHNRIVELLDTIFRVSQATSHAHARTHTHIHRSTRARNYSRKSACNLPRLAGDSPHARALTPFAPTRTHARAHTRTHNTRPPVVPLPGRPRSLSTQSRAPRRRIPFPEVRERRRAPVSRWHAMPARGHLHAEGGYPVEPGVLDVQDTSGTSGARVRAEGGRKGPSRARARGMLREIYFARMTPLLALAAAAAAAAQKKFRAYGALHLYMRLVRLSAAAAAAAEKKKKI